MPEGYPNAFLREVPWVDRRPEDVADLWARPWSPDLRQQLETWARDGIVIFKNAVPPELIDDLLSDIQHVRDNFSSYNISIEIRGNQTYSRAVTVSQINDPGVKFNHLHTLSDAAAHISLVNPVTEFLSAVFLAPPVVLQSLTFWRGSEQPTHIDYAFVNRQKRLAFLAASWVALEDTDPDSGPLAYFPGAHRAEISGFFDWGNDEIIKVPNSERNSREFAEYLDKRIEKSGIVPMEFYPKRGDVLVWHANMPHQGTKIRNNNLTRKSYVTHYTSLGDYPEGWQLPAESLEERSIREHGGYAFEFPWTDRRDKLPSAQRRFETATIGFEERTS